MSKEKRETQIEAPGYEGRVEVWIGRSGMNRLT